MSRPTRAPALYRSNFPMTLDQIRTYAPSVFAHHASDNVSQRYTMIPSSNVLKGLMDAGFEVFQAGQTLVRNHDNKLFAKHLLRFRKAGAKPIRKVGDEFPEIVLINSHDGTSAYQLLGGIYRLVCSNGMVLGRDHAGIKVRHSGNVVDNVIEGSFRVVDELSELSDRVEQYSAIELDDKEANLFAEKAIQVRWGENAIITPSDALAVKRFEDNGRDLWHTFNRVQENITKGGIAGRAASGRRVTTRAVNSVSVDVNLNRALFTLADEFAKLKVAS